MESVHLYQMRRYFVGGQAQYELELEAHIGLIDRIVWGTSTVTIGIIDHARQLSSSIDHMPTYYEAVSARRILKLTVPRHDFINYAKICFLECSGITKRIELRPDGDPFVDEDSILNVRKLR
jgi:hypothetical protein